MDTKKLYRSETNRQIAGVCGGIAEYFGADTSLVRLAFVIATLLGGPGIMVYLVMWLVVPEESQVMYQADMKRKNDDLSV